MLARVKEKLLFTGMILFQQPLSNQTKELRDHGASSFVLFFQQLFCVKNRQ